MITIDNLKQCTKCKEWKRATNEFFGSHKTGALGLHSQCRSCVCKRVREWGKANPERKKESELKWRKANPEREKESSRRWYKVNKEQVKESSRKRYEISKEQAKETGRNMITIDNQKQCGECKEWEPATNEFFGSQKKGALGLSAKCRRCISKWQRENPEKVAAGKHRRRARKANAAGTATADQIKARFQYYENCCYYCGENKPGLHIEHRIPLSKGGSNWPANLVPSCPSCNLSKGAKTEKEFLQIISERGDNEKP